MTHENRMSDKFLKPCPHCGSPATHTYFGESVWCSECMDGKTGLMHRTEWNLRYSEAHIQELREKVGKALEFLRPLTDGLHGEDCAAKDSDDIDFDDNPTDHLDGCDCGLAALVDGVGILNGIVSSMGGNFAALMKDEK
jgi:hypothetical protein